LGVTPVPEPILREEERHLPAIFLGVPADRDRVDGVERRARLAQAVVDRATGKTSERTLDADEALLLDEREQLPVANDARAGVLSEGRDPEDQHAATSRATRPTVVSSKPLRASSARKRSRIDMPASRFRT